jgi:predicted lipid-binding transport protein (Tim44 family)
MIVGYVTGRPISLLASLEGIVSGIMGGMMGAMLGVMLQPNSAQIMMAFLDVIYILVAALLLRVIDQEIKTKKNDRSKRTFIG